MSPRTIRTVSRVVEDRGFGARVFRVQILTSHNAVRDCTPEKTLARCFCFCLVHSLRWRGEVGVGGFGPRGCGRRNFPRALRAGPPAPQFWAFLALAVSFAFPPGDRQLLIWGPPPPLLHWEPRWGRGSGRLSLFADGPPATGTCRNLGISYERTVLASWGPRCQFQWLNLGFASEPLPQGVGPCSQKSSGPGWLDSPPPACPPTSPVAPSGLLRESTSTSSSQSGHGSPSGLCSMTLAPTVTPAR